MGRIRAREENIFHLLDFCVAADEQVIRHIRSVEKIYAAIIL
jgi:hypothetical protein